MKRMTLSEYLAVPENYRGVWTTERWDIPDWENLRKSHMGKRTLMVYDKGTCLLVEGLSLEIVDDSSWKKPEEIKKEIREKYQEYRTEKGREPHFLECIIRWNDTLETLETRIALVEKPNKFDPFGQKESAHLIYHTIAPLKVLVMGVNFILPF